MISCFAEPRTMLDAPGCRRRPGGTVVYSTALAIGKFDFPSLSSGAVVISVPVRAPLSRGDRMSV